MTDLRYPVGKPRMDGKITEAERRDLIESIAQAPARLRAAVEGLPPEQVVAAAPDFWRPKPTVAAKAKPKASEAAKGAAKGSQ